MSVLGSVPKFSHSYRVKRSYVITEPRECAMMDTLPLNLCFSLRASFVTAIFIYLAIVCKILGRKRGLRYARQSGTV